MRRALVCLALVGCGGATPRPAASARIEVRMANPQEFPPAPCEHQLPNGSCDMSFAAQCPSAGELSPAIDDAVAAFARDHLVQQLDKFTGYASKRVEVSIGNERATVADGFVTRVIVNGGQLELAQQEVFHGTASWGASIDYCLHVSVVGGIT